MSDQFLAGEMQSLRIAIRDAVGTERNPGPLRKLNDNMGNFDASVKDMRELSLDIQTLSSLMEQQLFANEWNDAVQYFQNKRVGAIPDEEQIVDRIARERKHKQQLMELARQKTKRL